MTLVIAEKLKGKISLCSDSRVSYSNTEFADFCIKIFSIPIKVFTTTNPSTKKRTIEFESKYGLAVVGSTVNSYIIKESITEYLQNVQYDNHNVQLSIEMIIDLVFKLYKKTSIELSNILRQKGICELILSGFCPKKKIIKSFRFYTDILPTGTGLDIKFEEILVKDELLFFGSGKKYVKKINKTNKYKPIKILREVINEGNDPKVGGGMQFGDFNSDNEFNVYGVEDYEFDEFDNVNYKRTLRGISLYENEFKIDFQNLFISYDFISPFTDEAKKILLDKISNK